MEPYFIRETPEAPLSGVETAELVKTDRLASVVSRNVLVLFLLFLPAFFLPWTQNILSRGKVTTLRPDQRPQTIHTVIGGRIEKWFVREGQQVQKGDTILYISEIKDDYFDPQLLNRTEDQIQSKKMAVANYMEKVKALDNQIDALFKSKELKLEQAQNKLKQAFLKVQSDSIDLEAAKTNQTIAEAQFKRNEDLYKQGLKSLTDFENFKQKRQEAEAKRIAQENKFLAALNDVINARVELGSIEAEFRDKLAKAESEKYASLSMMYDAEMAVTKMQNQYMNYSIRSGLYYILAPQDGFITKALRVGIGETIKEGTEVVSIMPSNFEFAVETFIRPVDIPLLSKDLPVRVQFDGWPALVFSGWPVVSFGTYGGKVLAVDPFISENGYFRVLIVPDTADHSWPANLSIGTGTNTFTLLQDVPVWYELWRQFNGFPPEYYDLVKENNGEGDKKDNKK
jgi:multidrug efflux pump subunit AcrA (membrane-fusion protein)